MNEWKKSSIELPKMPKRCFGYCHNQHELNSWKGIVDVWFDPEVGWTRCENYDKNPIRVLFWREMIEFPDFIHSIDYQTLVKNGEK